ncbi:MAG TPA: tetratricopeptide repeat protein [Tepidisphaeraceae bacterium]|nr:tetratricopeptide repeat protein [Tepidisphaeraceae bacterium]
MRFESRRSLSNAKYLFLAALIGVMLVGCADIITYSKDSRKHGLELYNQEQYADAAGAFRNATKQNPLDYQSYCYLGESYEQLGQHEQAIHAFRTSLEVMNKDVIGKHDIAFRQNVLNGYASAISKADTREAEINDLESHAKGDGAAENWFVLGKVFAFKGDPDSGIDAYSRATLSDPDNFYIAKEYGLYLQRLGQNQKAETALRKAYSLNPQDVEVTNALRSIGVVPGPSLEDQSALAKPIIPRGPIPEVDINKLTGNGPAQSNGAAAASVPRD